MPWIGRRLRDQKVWARVDGAGKMTAGTDGRVDVLYKLEAGAKVYRAAARNLEPTGDPSDELPRPDPEGELTKAPEKGSKKGSASPAAPKEGEIHVYTDGGCSGNPGPMGAGVVIMNGAAREELSLYLGRGTNQIAELAAIEAALDAIPESERSRPVVVHTDSQYAIGCVSLGWKIKANVELVMRLRKKAAAFSRLRFVKVPGHSGVPENERCDQLANAAIARGR